MSEWTDHDERQRVAQAQYEHIMTTPAPPAVGAYIDAGVIGFVFGEMWRRGVLTPRDRRWITLACVGATRQPVAPPSRRLRMTVVSAVIVNGATDAANREVVGLR